MKSQHIFIPLLIILGIALLLWITGCAFCWLLPLLFALGAAYLGWLMGGTWFGSLLGGKDKEIETAKASYAALKTDYNAYDKKYSLLSQDNDKIKREYAQTRTDWDGTRVKLEEKNRKWQTDYHALVADNEASKNDWLSEKKVFLSQLTEADGN